MQPTNSRETWIQNVLDVRRAMDAVSNVCDRASSHENVRGAGTREHPETNSIYLFSVYFFV